MKRTILPLLGLLSLAASSPVFAQSVNECDWKASAPSLAEPWETSTQTFANGAVRLALLDTIEPALGAFHLLILSPPYNELGDRQCKVISFDGDTGFTAMEFGALEAGYDPAVGLMFTVPVRVAAPEMDFTNGALLGVTLNQATGAIGTQITLGAD